MNRHKSTIKHLTHFFIHMQELERLTDGATASARAIRVKIRTLLDLADDDVLTSVADADTYFQNFTPPARTKEIGRQVLCMNVCTHMVYHMI